MARRNEPPIAQVEDVVVEENAPQPFALGEAPGPAEFPDPVEEPEKTGLATHTGTDPYGRAIGPKEDHRKGKVDVNGDTVPQAARKRKAALKAAAAREKR